MKVKTELNKHSTRANHTGRVCEVDLLASTVAAAAAAAVCRGAGGHRAAPTTGAV